MPPGGAVAVQVVLRRFGRPPSTFFFTNGLDDVPCVSPPPPPPSLPAAVWLYIFELAGIEKFNGKLVRRMAAFCSGLAEAARRHEDNDGAAAAERAASAREQAREHVGVYRREQDRRAREECEWLEVERAQEGEEEEDAAISMRDIFGSDSEEDDTEV